MKTNFKRLYLLFVAILVYNTQIFTQQSPATEQEFPIGAFLSILPENRTNPALYNSFEASGMNTIVPYANDATKQYLLNYNVIPWNQDPASQDWIQYYITGYYSKWEAEENKPFNDTVRVGVKHKYGQSAYWKDSLCWSTKGIATAKDSVMFGPHYHQEKFYRRFLVGNSYDLKYVPRINMALDYNPEIVNQNESVCRIKVVYRYTIVEGNPPYPKAEINLMPPRVLKVSDFNPDSSFKDITFGLPPNITYEYESIFRERSIQNKMLTETGDTPYYSDVFTDNGVQFCVDWLRNDTLCTLYINYAEIYDNDGWNAMVEDSLTAAIAIQNITDYAQNYSSWSNIKYWYGHDEPYTIDAITPSRIVSSIVKAAGGAPIITAQLIDVPPIWSPVNGELLYKRYFNAVQPEKLMIDYYPVVTERNMPECLEILRAVLSEAHSMQSGFWYVGQANRFTRYSDR